MAAKYQIGQRIMVAPVKAESLSARDSDIAQYAGQKGKVTDLYSLNPPGSAVFYIYTVRIEVGDKNIVLYEDEIQPDVT